MKCDDDFRANQETYPEGFFGDGDDSKADSIKLFTTVLIYQGAQTHPSLTFERKAGILPIGGVIRLRLK